MATTLKLVGDLEVLLRGMRAHEGLIDARIKQAATTAAAAELQDFATRERRAIQAVADAAEALGGPSTRLLPTAVPSPAAIVAAVAAQTQPFGDALLMEASAVRLLADRATVAAGLATALDREDVEVACEPARELYPEYAGWIVAAAAELVIDDESARLRPTAGQRLAGRVKDVAGLPFRARAVVGQGAGDAASWLADAARRATGAGRAA